MIRRWSAAVVAGALLVTIAAGSASASVSPAAALQAAFQAYQQGGGGVQVATFIHGGQAEFHAAVTEIDFEEAGAARLGPHDQTECSSNLFGIWFFFASGTSVAERQALDALQLRMWFGPAGGTLTPLAVRQSAVRMATSPAGIFGDPPAIQSKGVPVYGRLTAGVYSLHAETSDGGVWDVTDTIVDC